MTGRRHVPASESAPQAADPSHDCARGAVSEAGLARLKITVYRHAKGSWSVYMRLPDGSTESGEGIEDVLDVDALIWNRISDMELQA